MLLAIVIALMMVKFLVLWPLLRLFGLQGKAAAAVALLLAQCGEFALVLFALAHGKGLLDEILFQQLLIVVLLSMLATPALEKLSYRLFTSTRRDMATVSGTELSRTEQDSRPVILAGFGRVGRRIGHIMDLMQVPYVAIDKDVSIVDRERAAGTHVYFGDAMRPDVLRMAGVAEAPLVIVSINDLVAAERVVSTLHSAFPDIPVFARGHDRNQCQELVKLGAHYTVSETLEASAGLARAALLHMGAEAAAVAVALKQFRKGYYGLINKTGRERSGRQD
jgi:voltage-gated potassium channel Kch